MLIGSRGNQHVVYAFHVAELGESFIFDRQLINHSRVQDANSTETVPVLNAKKQ